MKRSFYIVDGLLLQPQVLCELLPVVKLGVLGYASHLRTYNC